ISAKADRPLNSNQKFFEISYHQGAIEFIKIEDETSVFIIGNHRKPLADEPKKRRLLQSLCLRNALLTTGNPISIFIKGLLPDDEMISEGFFGLVLPVFKVVSILPDPYISNQDPFISNQDPFVENPNGIIGPNEVENFNKQWRNEEDTLPDQFRFTIFSITHWNDEGISLQFSMNQSSMPHKINTDELVRILADNSSPCGPDVDESYHNEDIRKLVRFDAENVKAEPGKKILLHR
ncbi:MAG: hypothetical protein M3015_02235, partial [Bacteroidota bacterium]|nr:hypothetical protein [Bacteroidota bacterium]